VKKYFLIILMAAGLNLMAADTAPSSPASANVAVSAPASEKSIKELLQVMKVSATLDSMMSQIDSLMKSSVQAALQDRSMTKDEQKMMDTMMQKVSAKVKELLTYEKLEPVYIRIYQNSLNQAEVDGMIAFYKTPSGQAVINKLPLITKTSMEEVQKMMVPMMQEIQKEVAKTMNELEPKPKK
jgi:uncharacterized protein